MNAGYLVDLELFSGLGAYLGGIAVDSLSAAKYEIEIPYLLDGMSQNV
jgi:hypothetical protein